MGFSEALTHQILEAKDGWRSGEDQVDPGNPQRAATVQAGIVGIRYGRREERLSDEVHIKAG